MQANLKQQKNRYISSCPGIVGVSYKGVQKTFFGGDGDACYLYYDDGFTGITKSHQIVYVLIHV